MGNASRTPVLPTNVVQGIGPVMIHYFGKGNWVLKINDDNLIATTFPSRVIVLSLQN